MYGVGCRCLRHAPSEKVGGRAAGLKLRRRTRQCARQAEVRKQAGFEAVQCRDAITRQGEHQQSNAVKNGRTRIRHVQPNAG